MRSSGISATPALAKPKPPSPYAVFSDCPTSNPAVGTCLYSDTTSGSFTIGNTTVTIGSTPIIFQGGLQTSPSGYQFFDATDGNTLSQVPLTVPGGLLGLTPPSLFPLPLQGIIENAINSVNTVTATAQLVGTPSFNPVNFLTGNGSAVSLPVRIHLSNPFLGSGCYIGSSSDPVTLDLTTGTTSPPASVAPLTGSHGTLTALHDGGLIEASNVLIVGNTFAVPGASGCGGLLSALVDPVVDLKTGIPAAPGVSSASLAGSSALASAKLVKKAGY